MSSEISAERLVADLQTFAAELGKTPTRAQMNEDGPHSSTPYYSEWGSWNAALEAAGLATNHREDTTDEELCAELRRLAGELDRLPRFEDMAEYGAFSPHTYARRFGSWGEAKAEAGLDEETRTSRRIPEPKLVDALRELADELGKTPTQEEMSEYGRYSHRPYYRAFDSWEDALETAGLNSEHELGIEDEDLIDALEELAEDLGRTPTVAEVKERGRYSVWPFLRAFGSWNQAVEAAGLEMNKEHGVVEDGPIEYGPNWPRQREKALERDGYICQAEDCQITEERHQEEHGEGLHVHHRTKFRKFDDYEEANQLENLVTLCRPCHYEWEKRSYGVVKETEKVER